MKSAESSMHALSLRLLDDRLEFIDKVLHSPGMQQAGDEEEEEVEEVEEQIDAIPKEKPAEEGGNPVNDEIPKHASIQFVVRKHLPKLNMLKSMKKNSARNRNALLKSIELNRNNVRKSIQMELEEDS